MKLLFVAAITFTILLNLLILNIFVMDHCLNTENPKLLFCELLPGPSEQIAEDSNKNLNYKEE